MKSKRWIFLVLAIMWAVFLLFWEISHIISTFLKETTSFFWSWSIWWDIFISYIKTILTILMLAYLFVWFWGKFQSPLVSMVNIIDDINSVSLENISKKDKIALFISLAIVYIGIIFYTKYLVVQFANTTTTIIGIVYQLISIAIYFWISFFTLILLRNACINFIKYNEWFIKITLYSTTYIFLLWFFNKIFWFLMKFVNNLFSNLF